jgi:hypothetical protein
MPAITTTVSAPSAGHLIVHSLAVRLVIGGGQRGPDLEEQLPGHDPHQQDRDEAREGRHPVGERGDEVADERDAEVHDDVDEVRAEVWVGQGECRSGQQPDEEDQANRHQDHHPRMPSHGRHPDDRIGQPSGVGLWSAEGEQLGAEDRQELGRVAPVDVVVRHDR